MSAKGDIDIRDDLTIIGLDGRDATVIESTVEDRVLHLPCFSIVRIEGITVRGGRGVSDGGRDRESRRPDAYREHRQRELGGKPYNQTISHW